VVHDRDLGGGEDESGQAAGGEEAALSCGADARRAAAAGGGRRPRPPSPRTLHGSAALEPVAAGRKNAVSCMPPAWLLSGSLQSLSSMIQWMAENFLS
jgi:hypothetical protein